MTLYKLVPVEDIERLEEARKELCEKYDLTKHRIYSTLHHITHRKYEIAEAHDDLYLLPFTSEEMELQLIDLFFEHGYSRTPYELVSCWEKRYMDRFDEESINEPHEKHVSKLRMLLIVREGLHKIAEFIYDNKLEVIQDRYNLLKEDK